MRKKILFILLSFSFSLAGLSQAVLFINAGSRAAWGSHQEITIDINGNGRYNLREVNGPVKDSVIFRISTQQLQEIFNKAEQSGFFNLNTEYKGKAVDGAGILISMNSAGKKHRVHLLNTDHPVISELVTLMNTMLSVHNIRINTDQFVTK